MRLIDADALLDKLLPIAFGLEHEYGSLGGAVSGVMRHVEAAPTIDVAPVRHGQWVHTDYAIHWTAKDECSECTYHASDRDDLSHYNYCPNCGAKMDLED